MLKQHEQRFLDALQAYQDNAKPKYRVDIALSLGNKHTWEDVLQAVEELQKRRSERTGVWAKVTDKLRTFGDRSGIFRQWVEFLPTQNEYFSVLCGGLKLILGVCVQYLRSQRSLMRSGRCETEERSRVR